MNQKEFAKYTDTIYNAFLFKGVDTEELNKALLSEIVSCRRYAAGEVIFSPERFENSIGIIVSGSALVTKPSGERSVVMSTLTAGSIFGAITLFGGFETFATEITAQKRCTVVFLPQNTIKSLIKKDFTLAENFLEYLTERIYFLNKKIESYTSSSAVSKLAMFLIDCAEQTPAGHECKLTYSMKRLAEVLSISRASLYRAFSALEREGLIKRDKNIVKVIDIRRLYLI